MTGRRSVAAGTAAALLVLAVGLAGVRWAYPTFQGREAVLGLLTGLIVASAGLIAWRGASASRIGPILVISGLLWFPADWRLPVEPVSIASHWLALAFASVMTHALLTYPSGRSGSAAMRSLVAVAYLAAILPPAGGAAVLACLLAGRLAWLYRTRDAIRRPERLHVAALGAVFGAVLLLTTARPFVAIGARSIDLRLLLELSLVISACYLAAQLIRARRRSSVADLVLDLGDSRGGSLAFELGLLLDDPTLQIGFRLPGRDGFVDGDGRPVTLPAPDGDRGTTLVERDGSPVAVLIHRPHLTTDPILRGALVRAASLAAANASLQAELRAQMREVEASRRRLVAAGDEERQGLERRLRQGPERRLAALTAELDDAGRPVARSQAVAGPLHRALGQLASARDELAELADGLHPRILDRLGLAGALAELAGRCPVPVEVDMDADLRLGPAGEATVYFLTSEGLANVAKHSGAAQAWVSLRSSPDGARLEIADDGTGGADAGRGSGLRGLRDRVEAVGGSLELDSAPGRGTLLAATIPWDGEEFRSG